MIALPETKTAPMLAALAYCDLVPGRFFPLRESQKTPAIASWQVVASSDPEQVRTWARKHPTANIGFVPDPEFFILDIDCKGSTNGFETLAGLEAATGEKLPVTLAARTPSGGQHLFFRGGDLPFKTCTNAGGHKGLDIRAGGASAGYVVLAPSEIDNGVYSWMNWPSDGSAPHIAEAPKWLLTLACGVDPCAVPRPERERKPSAHGGDDALTIKHLRDALKFLDFNNYDDWIAHGVALKTLDDAGLELWLEWSAGYAKYDKAEALAKWETFKPTKTGYRAIFAKAQAAGWVNPGGFSSAPPLEDAIADFNRNHAVVLAGGSSVVMRNTVDERGNPSYEFLTRSAASMFYENLTVPVPKTLADGQVIFKPAPLLNVWLKHPDRKTFGGITFAPGGDVPEGFFNTWHGLAVEPLPISIWKAARKCRRLLHHIRHNMCRDNRQHYRYFLAWVADMLQNPGVKQGVACVVRGAKGVGKSKVAEALQAIIGNHAFKAAQSQKIVGHFNQQLLDKLLIIAEESFFAGSKADNGTLKDMITSPTITIEPKGINAFEARSCHRIYMITNHEWAVPASEDERRFFVLDVGEDHKQDFSYFAAIDDELYKSDGLQAFLTLLLKLDISGVNLRKVPQTDGLARQKVLSLEPHDQFILDCLHGGEIAGEVWPEDRPEKNETNRDPRRQDVYDAYVQYARAMQVRPVAANRFGKVFEARTGAIPYQPGSDDRRRKYELPKLSEALKRFHSQLGIRYDHDE